MFAHRLPNPPDGWYWVGCDGGVGEALATAVGYATPSSGTGAAVGAELSLVLAVFAEFQFVLSLSKHSRSRPQ